MKELNAATDFHRTSQLAAATGYSVQQVRDLERLGVIPDAVRQHNGYRRFGAEHVAALHAYRLLAEAVNPVVARATMRDVQTLPRAEAVALIVDLHVTLARARTNSIAAIEALNSIVEEQVIDAASTPADAMTITELGTAIGVRSSTLRFWEHEGLLAPERAPELNTRLYPLAEIRYARIVAALRAGGYRIPAVQAVMESLRSIGDADDARTALQTRLRTIAAQSEALLRAGAYLADVISRRAPAEPAIETQVANDI